MKATLKPETVYTLQINEVLISDLKETGSLGPIKLLANEAGHEVYILDEASAVQTTLAILGSPFGAETLDATILIANKKVTDLLNY